MSKNLLVLLVLVPLSAGAEKPGRLVNDDDDFRGWKVLSLQDADVDLQAGRILEVRISKMKVKGIESALVMLFTNPGDYGVPPRYSDCHDLAFLVDGKPLRTSIMKVRYNEHSTGESVSTGLEMGELRKIAKAKSVRGRLCRDEFSVGPALLASIGKLVEAKYGSVPKEKQGD